MNWDFEETPITIRTEDGDQFQVGMFDGNFEIDEIGMIQTITLKQYEGNGYLTLRQFREGDRHSFRADLFRALERTLAKRFEDEINECLDDLRGVPEVRQIEQDRAIYHQSVL